MVSWVAGAVGGGLLEPALKVFSKVVAEDLRHMLGRDWAPMPDEAITAERKSNCRVRVSSRDLSTEVTDAECRL